MKNKLMFNEDWTHYLRACFVDDIDMTEDVIKSFIYKYKDSQITDFVMNVNGTTSAYPSVTKDSFSDKYLRKSENSTDVDFTDTFAKKAYEIYCEKNLDVYEIWIKALREINIKPWISFRINDVHFNQEKASVVKSKEVEEYPEFWRIRHREANGYYDKALDFGNEGVRNNFLAYIEETLKRYRPDGIEIDFTREPFLFRPGYERRDKKFIDEMMKNIKALCNKYPDKDNNPLPVNVLVCGKISTVVGMGMDVFEWVKKGYIDSVVNIAHWGSINTDYEIDEWKQLLDNRVPFGCGLQILLNINPDKMKIQLSDVDMAFGQAYANVCSGCDFTYLYNYMDPTEPSIEEFNFDTSVRTKENMSLIVKNIGNINTIKKHNRRHPLTFSDMVPYWERVNSRLPIKFNSRAAQCLRIRTGQIYAEDDAYIILSFERDIEYCDVYVNCQKAEFYKRGGLDRNVIDKDGYMYKIDAPIENYAMIEVIANEGAVMEYAEIFVMPNIE